MKTIFLSFLTLLIVSCSLKDDPDPTCTQILPAPVETVVSIPNTAVDTVGYLFNVGFRVSDGCGNFDSFEQTTNGTVTTIKVIAKYEGCVCTQNAPLRETVYAFSETNPGVYTLKFKMYEDNYITKVVTIE